MANTPTQTNGIRKTLYHLISGDSAKAASALEPVIKEKIKLRYRRIAQNILSTGGK